MNKINNEYSNHECERCALNDECIHAHDSIHIYGCIGFMDRYDSTTYKNKDVEHFQ